MHSVVLRRRGDAERCRQKKRARLASRPLLVAEAEERYLTSNSRPCTTAPSSETSTLYLPVGQPSGLLIWKSVTPLPVKFTSLLSSCTTCPLSTWVHFTPSLPGTVAVASLVVVATEAWMVSLVPKVVIGEATFMSAPTALPRSMLVTDAVAAMAGAGGMGAGSAAGGGVTAGASFFLQPARATVQSTATIRAWARRLLRFMRWVPCANSKGGRWSVRGPMSARP